MCQVCDIEMKYWTQATYEITKNFILTHGSEGLSPRSSLSVDLGYCSEHLLDRTLMSEIRKKKRKTESSRSLNSLPGLSSSDLRTTHSVHLGGPPEVYIAPLQGSTLHSHGL